jgi:hypothetical protein
MGAWLREQKMETSSKAKEDYWADQVEDADKDVLLELFAKVVVCA